MENNLKDKLCDYGCGEKAKFFFKTVNKWCCSKTHQSCPIIRQKNCKNHADVKGSKNPMYGKFQSIETRLKCGTGMLGKKHSQETIKKFKKRKCSEKVKEINRQRMLNGQSLTMIKKIKKISNEEIKLRNMVKDLFPKCEFQYGVFGYALDVALVEEKIAIEYDGYYHFHTEEMKEYYKFRKERIEKEGWKFLSYTMFDIFPNLEKLKEDIKNIKLT